MSVLAPEKRAAVVECLRAGKGIRETARETGVNKTTVTNIGQDIGCSPRAKGYRCGYRQKAPADAAPQPVEPDPEVIAVRLSQQSIELLRQLTEKGIYGRDTAEVAARFVDAALERFIEPPRISFPSESTKEK